MKDFLNLNFIGRSNGPVNSTADVSISKNKKGYTFTFRNGTGDKIGSYAMIAVSGNAIFFKEDKTQGYAVSGNDAHNKCDNKYLRINAKVTGLNLDRFIGDYSIKYFEALKLYYIEKPKHGGENNEIIN